MKVDSNDPRPSYAQVAARLRAAIEAGDLGSGQRLPSGRALADEYGVALMTVQKAIDVLRADGLVTSHQGRGVFVSADTPTTTVDPLNELKAELGDLRRRVANLEARLVGSDGDA